MKIKMWCLVNKEKDRIISIGGGGGFAVGFDTKKDLIAAIDGHVEYDEEIRKIEIKVK